MFNPINFTINWEFILGFIPIFGLIITGTSKLFQRFKKVIFINNSSLSTNLRKPSEIESYTRIFVDGIEVNSISKIVIVFSNAGKETLNCTDFNITPLIDLVGFTNIINVFIYASNEFVKINPKKLLESRIELEIDNLEPRAYIRIEILFESIDDDYKPYFKCCLKGNSTQEVDLKELERNKDIDVEHSYGPILPMIGIGFAITIGLTFLFARYGLGINFTNLENYEFGWQILFFSPSIIVAGLLAGTMIKRINIKYYGWLKVKNWHLFHAGKLNSQ